MEGEVDPELKISSEYTVQLPSPEVSEEVIPTPPLAPELGLRFSQRNPQMRQVDMETRAINLAKSKNMEGISKTAHTNSFSALADSELMCRASKMGVLIPDNDFACIDVLKELECVRGNLADKNNNKVNEPEPDDMFVTNELGKLLLCVLPG